LRTQEDFSMADTARKDGTKTSRPSSGDPAPRLPHEHDESHDSQSSGPRKDMQQAHWDITHGLVDTDMHGERGVEEVVKDDPKKERDGSGAPPPEPGQH
jgi:hypothetical protein